MNDLLATTKGDWQLSERDHLSFRYSVQREEDTAASMLIRALGSATQRQHASRLAVRYPEAGGAYVYLREA